MKNLKLLLILSLIVFAISLQAQNNAVSIKFSEAQGQGLNEGNLGVIGITDDGFYVLRAKSSALQKAGIFIDKYSNASLDRIKTTAIDGIELTLGGRPRGSSYEFALQDSDNNLYVYFSEYVKGVNSLYSLKLDPYSFEFGDEQLIYQDKKAKKRLDRRSTYALVESEDRNKFAIYSVVNQRFTNNSQLYIEVFDRDRNSLWEKYEIVEGRENGNTKTPAFGVTTKSSTVNTTFSISLSNDGVVNIMKKDYEDSFSNILGAGDYFHEIFTISAESGRLKSKKFDNEERFIVDAMIRHDQNDNLSLVGFIGNRERVIDGVIFRSMNPITFNTITERIISFTPEQKKQFLISQDNERSRKRFGEKIADQRTERRIDKGRRVRISARNNILNTYVHEDNSITIVSEYFDEFVTSTPRTNGTMDTETNYLFGDLKFVNVNDEGEINWIKNIHKYQKSTSTVYLSVSELFLDNEIKLIYNDFQERKLMLLSVEESGKNNFYEIADLGRRGALENHWFLPSSVKYLSESSIVCFANRFLKTKIIKIDL